MRSAGNQAVRRYWEKEPCGTGEKVTGGSTAATREYFERVEEYRYQVEPFIHSIAQFTRHHGKDMLEVGVGAGTDHLQWARAGLKCHGVDLTDAAVTMTRERLAVYGLSSQLNRVDAERLPFPDATFDLVYSWGVIHHAENPELMVREIRRVLRPGGTFIGMVYGRHSLKVVKTWLWFALLRARPWMTFTQVLARYVESPGTKAYTVNECKRLFADFREFQAQRLLTVYDTRLVPRWLARFLPDDWGWFVAIHAV